MLTKHDIMSEVENSCLSESKNLEQDKDKCIYENEERSNATYENKEIIAASQAPPIPERNKSEQHTPKLPPRNILPHPIFTTENSNQSQC